MFSFFNDYSEGAHPRILAALQETNLQQEPGYGLDSFSQAAADLLRDLIKQPGAAIHFVTTGTQANLITLSSFLKSYESIIAAEHGHISVHETGALEATGHKVHALPSRFGKLDPESIRELMAFHKDEHCVQPRALYISQATEVGTIYSKQELQALRAVCNEHQLYFFLDGARLGNAVMAEGNDADLADIAALCDAFYIGGTKNGALLGEAVVIVNPALQDSFRYHLKQRGALMAKGRVIAVQFRELFQDGLYFENACHANAMAKKLAHGIQTHGYAFAQEPQTNQLFPIFPDTVIEELKKDYGFYVWEKNSAGSVIRLVTSWATPEAAVEHFLKDLTELKKRD
ncbi:MAG: low specificity L-threonine aldolase [Chthoniobacterales bacterium]|nr:low specificity L-threonine aldolase [Chthoniobacterales bacterium]